MMPPVPYLCWFKEEKCCNPPHVIFFTFNVLLPLLLALKRSPKGKVIHMTGQYHLNKHCELLVHKCGLIHVAIHCSCRLIVICHILSMLSCEQTIRNSHIDRKQFHNDSSSLCMHISFFCFITDVGRCIAICLLDSVRYIFHTFQFLFALEQRVCCIGKGMTTVIRISVRAPITVKVNLNNYSLGDASKDGYCKRIYMTSQ